MNKKNTLTLLSFIIFIVFLNACSSTVDRLRRVGKDPELAKIELPTTEEEQEDRELRKEKSYAQHAYMQKTNSLWQPGATKFFRDSRAWRVGDIIRVVVEIQDKATLDNATEQKRSGKDSMGMPQVFGKEKAISTFLSSKGSATSFLSTNSSRNHSGSGNISRKENINTEIAAIVVKVLPSGNLVIQGRQEVRVNSELREIKVAGIIRPKDISSENSIKTNQLAEARISYGGRGVVSDMQQPRVGSQLVDIVAPF